MFSMKKVAILTSGGDTPGMNAAIQAAVKMARASGITPMGILKGYDGLIKGRIFEIPESYVEGIVIKGGTILKTARCLEMRTDQGIITALSSIEAFNLDGLIVIGGDGSMKGAKALADRGVRVVALPATIDNDLAYTDYTIGFDTARNCVVGEVEKIRDTMSSHERVGVIEVMGNKCGDIALHAGIATESEFILVPEMPFDVDGVCQGLLEQNMCGKNTSIIIIAEGAGKAEALANYIRAKTGLDVKDIVLGYVQRGGSPSAFDRIIATKMGICAIELLKEGKTCRAIGIKNNNIIDMDIDEALSMKLKFDRKFYDTYDNINDF